MVYTGCTVCTRRPLWRETTCIRHGGALLVANTSSSCLPRVPPITKCSAIMIFNYVFCFFPSHREEVPAWLSMEEVCTARGLRGTLSSHSDLYRMEFDESLIGLGKHPHGVCLRTKGAILSSLVEANALRSDKWLVSRCLLLTTSSKTWWDSWGPQGYINLNLNVYWISSELLLLLLDVLFPPAALHQLYMCCEEKWDTRFADVLH